MGVLLVVGPWAAADPADDAPSGSDATSEGSSITEGMSISDALFLLAGKGLKVVFTDEVVKPELRVLRRPRGSSPEDVLHEILLDHGLTARLGADGTYFVLPGAQRPPGGLHGTIVDQETGAPISGAHVSSTQIPGARTSGAGVSSSSQAVTTTADASGRFEMVGLEPGEHGITVTAPSYLPVDTAVRILPRESAAIEVELQATPTLTGMIDVHAGTGRGSLGDPAPLSQGRAELASLPRLGDDALGGVPHLPGTANGELSAAPSIRGGRSDQVLVLLDGLEILEPYHLKDYGDALSIVSSDVLEEARLLSGGYSVEFGGRLSGVLDLVSIRPSWRRQIELGLSLIEAKAGISGSSAKDRAHGLAFLRRSFLDVSLRAAENQAELPEFFDGFAKGDLAFSERSVLRGHILIADDRLSFEEETGREQQRFGNRYRSAYVWLTHHSLLGARSEVQTQLSWSRIQRDRDGNERDDDVNTFEVNDRRLLRVPALSQDWTFRGGDHQLKWGFRLQRPDVSFDYRNSRTLEEALAELYGTPRESSALFNETFRSELLDVYLADHLTFGRASLDVGVRYDESTLTDDELFSPRLALALRLAQRSHLRIAWGRFFQSQQPHELQVEDGVTEFQKPETAREWVLGFEHRFVETLGPLTSLRIEAYDRDIQDPRSRFENLANTFTKLPEVRPDRTLITPLSSQARGIELFLQGRIANRFDWTAGYTLSSAEDQTESGTVRHRNDQPHSVDLSVFWRAFWKLDLGFAVECHSGWPTTAVLDDPSEPRLGPTYGERLPTYLRADFQLRRGWELAKGRIELTLNIHNVTNRKNLRGFDLRFEPTEGGGIEVVNDPEHWAGIVPSVGLSLKL